MSLYNQLFGNNPILPLLLGLAHFDPQVGTSRLRDAYLTKDEDGSPLIGLYLRIGGRHRAHGGDGIFTPEAKAPEGMDCTCCGCTLKHYVQKRPGYVRDVDSSTDSTYLMAYFKLDEPGKQVYAFIVKHKLADYPNPESFFPLLMAKMNDPSQKNDPMIQRAYAVGERVFGEISEDKGPHGTGPAGMKIVAV